MNKKNTKKPQNFKNLAQNLDSRLNRLELDLTESIEMLEHHLQKLARKNKQQKDITRDINRLSELLNTRLKKSIQALQERSQDRHDDRKVRQIKELTAPLVKLLSFDFYRGVLRGLTREESESEVDAFGMDSLMVQRIKPFFDFLYYKYWRVETTGINHIPNTGRALIVGNHSGTLPYDGAMLAAAIYNEHPVRRDARFLVENFVYHMPFLGSFMYRIGGVRACPQNAERLLDQNHLVVVFPEGVKGIGKYYSQRYQLQRFGRGGFIKLCIKTKTPLIPVGIVGAEEIHPIVGKSNILSKTIGVPYIPITPTFPLLGILGIIPLPTKWYIHFGKPMRLEDYPPDTLDDELRIHELSEKVREEIQKILIELLKKRRSVWLG